jgi:hypothetical protein
MALTRIQTAALQSSITGSNITDGSIAAADLASGSVTPVKLSTGAPTWDTSGSVGIGGSPNSWNTFTGALQIAGASLSGLGANNTALGSNAYYNTSWKYYGSASATLYQQVAGQHYWQIAGVGTAGNAISFSNAMVLDSSGNVSISNISRTSSTNATSIVLSDIVTGLQTNGVYKSIRSQSNGGTSVSEIRFLETDGTNNNTGIVFATQSTASALTERVRVTPSGNVLIGTTVDMTGSGGLKLGGNFSFGASALQATNTNYTVTDGTLSVTFYSLSGNVTVTLPNATTFVGRQIWLRVQSSFTVNSASSNVTALANGAVTNAILPATAGKWALLMSDGSYWNIIAAN